VRAPEELSKLPRGNAGDIAVEVLGNLPKDAAEPSDAKMTIFLQMSLGWCLWWPKNMAVMIIMTMLMMSIVSVLRRKI
jgi:hypothetical protein